MRKVDHYDTDEIEFSLQQYAGYWYTVRWRFKPVVIEPESEGKFLFFRYKKPAILSNESWHDIMEYQIHGVDPGGTSYNDPFSDNAWHPVRINAATPQGRNKYDSIRHGCKTYYDLDMMFSITANEKKWEGDKKHYNELMKETVKFLQGQKAEQQENSRNYMP